MKDLIKTFSVISIDDIPTVGGKNASLGEMFNELSSEGVQVPDGFATTSSAFRLFLKENSLSKKLQQLMGELDHEEYSNLKEKAGKARELIFQGRFSEDFVQAIEEAYIKLGNGKEIPVAVRSSATAEDLPQASFAGQHDSFLNITGKKPLLEAVKSVLLHFIQTGL